MAETRDPQQDEEQENHRGADQAMPSATSLPHFAARQKAFHSV